MGKNLWPIVAVGDLHFPFHSKKTVQFILDFIWQVKPKIIIQMGDLYDLYSFSRFPKRLRLTPDQEIESGYALAHKFWESVRKTAPRAKLFQIKGNHDHRAYLRTLEKFPEIFAMTEFKTIWDFKGVESFSSPKEDLTINGIVFTHGHFSKLGDHMANCDFMPVVRAHSHKGGVHFRRIGKKEGKISWELDCGYAGDPFSPELIYRPMKKFFTWTHGVGFIDEFAPCFIPRGGKD